MGEYRYKAFISYSWADAAWGKWAHHALETYRTPAALVGKEGALGPVPARLHPIFKDREEEAAGASIGAAVESALANSEFLVVICSPNSAKSQWVDREIAMFKTRRDPAKVLALIVDGEPGDPARECFPRALTHAVGEDLAIGAALADAPLAADARITGDGKRRARLKLAAAMLGVGLDELVNRDDRRRALRTRIVIAASVTLALVMSALTLVAVRARNEAERQRAEADGLIEFMLTDLRDKLEPVGRLDALDVVGERALDYYARQKLASLDPDSLGRRSRALHLVGEVRNIRGDSEAGLKAFEQASRTTAELLARAPGDAQRIFDHAQSVFWVGYIAYERGETKKAEAQFREYKRLADQLVALDPEKPEWRMESSYAETNLGVMYDQQRRYLEAERAFANGLKQIEAVAASEPWSADRQIEMGVMVNWLGATRKNLLQPQEAIKLHDREIAIYRDVLRRDPANTSARNRLAVAWNYLIGARIDAGDIDGSIAAGETALRQIAALRVLEPGNTEWQQTEAGTLYMQAENAVYDRRYADSRALLARGDVLTAKLSRTDPTNQVWTQEFPARSLRLRMQLGLAAGDLAGADTAARQVVERADSLQDGAGAAFVGGLYRWAGDVQARRGKRERAIELWQTALNRLSRTDTGMSQKYVALKRLGRTAEADKLAKVLDRRGYKHPAYLTER